MFSPLANPDLSSSSFSIGGFGELCGNLLVTTSLQSYNRFSLFAAQC